MNTFTEVFKKGKSLITYISGGDPDLEMTEKLIFKLAESGVDILEIGIPFSDPLADGPVIQAASQRALKKNVSLKLILEKLEAIKGEIHIPLILMGYYNSILNYGKSKFISKIKKAGIAGVIIPDLPFDEEPEFYNDLQKNNIATVLLITPNTNLERLKQIIIHTTGFLYCVSLLGVTGDKRGPDREIKDFIIKVKKYAGELPLALGFGIDSPEKVKNVIDYVDGIIIGSALIQAINKAESDKQMLLNAEKFVKNIKNVM